MVFSYIFHQNIRFSTGIDSSFVSLCDLRLLELTTDMESSKIEGVDQFFFPANIFRNPLFAGLIRDEIPAYGPPIGEWPMSHAKVMVCIIGCIRLFLSHGDER